MTNGLLLSFLTGEPITPRCAQEKLMSDETLPTLRFAINLGNAVLASLTPDGQPAGITVELAKDIARHLHCRPEFITYPAAGKVVEDAGQDIWDIAFLAIDPKREDRLRFTSPYITIKGPCWCANRVTGEALATWISRVSSSMWVRMRPMTSGYHASYIMQR
jgi:ABC-type amino acid transport substrate-binding protein